MRAQRGRLIAMFAPAGVLATVIVAAVAPVVLLLACGAGVVVLIGGRAARDRTETARPLPAAEPIEPRTVTVRHFGQR